MMNIFNLFSKKKKEMPPTVFEPNEKLKQAIVRHTESPNDIRFLKLMYKAAGQGFLMVSVDRPPPTDSSGMITETTTVKMLTSYGPTGDLVLQAFTDGSEAVKRLGNRSDVGVICQKSLDILKLATEPEYNGVIINAAGPWVVIQKSVIQDIIAGKYA